MDWQPIESAPMDGTPIRAMIDEWPNECVIAFQDGFLDESGEECGSWVCLEGNPPPCWTDGVCWSANEDEMPSSRPIRWKPKGGRVMNGIKIDDVRCLGRVNDMGEQDSDGSYIAFECIEQGDPEDGFLRLTFVVLEGVAQNFTSELENAVWNRSQDT